MTNIVGALHAFTGAITAVGAEKAKLHAEHIATNAANSQAVSNEAGTALAALTAAGDAALTTLVAELGIVDVNSGTASSDKDKNEATIETIDANLAAIESTREALAAARAALDEKLEAVCTAAKIARAKLFIDNVEI